MNPSSHVWLTTAPNVVDSVPSISVPPVFPLAGVPGSPQSTGDYYYTKCIIIEVLSSYQHRLAMALTILHLADILVP